MEGHNLIPIKKSPIAIVKSFLVVQILAVALFFIASSLAYYARIYRTLPLANAISFQIAEIIFIIACETALVFFIFFSWYKEYLFVKKDKLVYGHGVLFRKETVIPLHQVQSVTYHQGPLGRLTRYGVLEILGPGAKRALRLADIPEPKQVVQQIVEAKQSFSSMPSASLASLLEAPENEQLEFKSTLRWDIKAQRVNRTLEKAVMKTITAFLNSHGGQLVLGVGDDRQICGLTEDYATLQRTDADGFENHFSQVFASMIGPEFRQHIKLLRHTIENKDCYVINVAASMKPVYLRSDNNEEFVIRTGNTTTSLKLSEAAAYIEDRFKKV